MSSPLVVTTPLGTDAFAVVGMSGGESVSRLFSFDLDLTALNPTAVPFEQIVGKPVSLAVAMPAGGTRFFHGICSRLSQGRRDSTSTSYRAEVVPWLWLRTLRRNSRIFQHKTVPEILQLVLTGGPLTMQLKATYKPREYCVQYRETDFEFASRLMEEEGIYYYFRHTSAGHMMVVTDAHGTAPPVISPSILSFAASVPPSPDSSTVTDWEKLQELRSGRVTLRDFHFELPDATLESDAATPDVVRVGTVDHHLHLDNDGLERYDYPGGYAKRFDGIDPAGVATADLANVQPEGNRLAGVRMGEEAAHALLVEGRSNCRQLGAGLLFSLKNHFNANGKYIVMGCTHRYTVSGDPRNAAQSNVSYHNDFEAIPLALPFRPERVTPTPVVAGPQSAVVVGPAGEQVFTDKYGRVKVQFHWDREGKKDANSSCWVRVASLHAGQEQGFVAAPRIGQEVVVDFLEGDPDQPIIVGSVYNPNRLPPPGSGATGG